MNKDEILGIVDHTLLKQQATWENIKEICDDGIKYNTASVCIPPSFVKKAVEYVADKVKICTVIGFPNGYNTTETKVFETQNAIKNGAEEIDMVINIGDLKDKNYDNILREINEIKEACNGKILKVIIEIVSKSNADYIKTSTGFSTNGATQEDIKLFKKYISNEKGIKAAGGISSFEDAIEFVSNGATRLGTSRLIKIINQNKIGRASCRERV